MRAGEICCDEYGMEEMNAKIMNQLSNECLQRKNNCISHSNSMAVELIAVHRRMKVKLLIIR